MARIDAFAGATFLLCLCACSGAVSGSAEPAGTGGASGSLDAGGPDDADARPSDSQAEEGEGCPGSQTTCGAACVDTNSDPQNCGACGRDCGLVSCVMGSCEILPLAYSSGDFFTGLALHEDDVYFVTASPPTGGALRRVSKSGGSVEQLAASGGAASGVAISGSMAYWTDSDSGGLGKVLRVGLAGGAPEVLASGPPDGPTDMTVMGKHVLWTDYGAGTQGQGAIRSFDTEEGSNSQVLADLTTPLGLSVFDGWLFFADFSYGNVFSRPPGVLKPLQIFQAAEHGVGKTAFDGARVYFTQTEAADPSTITSVGPTGADPLVLASVSGQPGVGYAIVVDGYHVYWTKQDRFGQTPPEVWRTPKTGGSSTKIAVSAVAGLVMGLALDDTHVFFTVGKYANQETALYRAMK